MLSNSVDEDINVQPFDEDVKQKSMSHRDIEKQSETSTEVVEEA